MLESTLSLLSLWTCMSSWLTPAVLFLLLNLMIGTIAVTSAFSSSPPKPLHHHHHLNHHHINHHVHHQQLQPPPQIQTQLSRSPSVLQRLKSLSFYPSYFNSTHHHLHQHQQSQPEPEPEPEPHHEVHEAAPPPTVEVEVDNDDDVGPTLEEVFSKIVKKGNYGRQNSDTKPIGGDLPVPLPSKIIQKSATNDSAFAHFHSTSAAGDNADVSVAPLPPPPVVSGVDEMADDFINRFRQNLRLQRLESLYAAGNNK